MKKITPTRRAQILLATKRRWRTKLARRNRRYKDRSSTKIDAPSVLSFRENYTGTVDFLNALRDATVGTVRLRGKVEVDLVPVRKMSVPVAIVLAAEFHRWSLVRRVRLHPKKMRQWAPEVRGLLLDLGAFSLLGLEMPKYGDNSSSNVTLTRLSSGVRCDGQKIDRLQSQFTSVLRGFTTKPEVYAGLTEAVENAIAHAYPPDFDPRHTFAGHRWWGASCIDLIDHRLRFFVFDQGAGIPFTLPTQDWWENVRAWLSEFTDGAIGNDAVMLKAAFEVGRTRTLQTNRGLGLDRMAGVVRGTDQAYLRVLSGRGEIVYHSDDRIETHDHALGVGGTLIEFSMPADVFGVATGVDEVDADD